jgi:hypothetical protein
VQTYSYDPKNGNVTATIAPFVYKTPFSDTSSGAKSNYKGDLALILNGDLSLKSSLEISILHMNKQYFREEGPLAILEEVQAMHIAMGYRRWLHPYLSGALAFYSAYPMDDKKTVHNDFAPGAELQTSAGDKTEYGLDFSVQTELWGNETMSVIADARYAFSITNQSQEKGDHYAFMIGIKFLAQQKFPDKK